MGGRGGWLEGSGGGADGRGHVLAQLKDMIPEKVRESTRFFPCFTKTRKHGFCSRDHHNSGLYN